MTDNIREAFRERMASAVRFFAAAPDDSSARRELASLLTYGPGARALFDEVLQGLTGDSSISRAALTSLRAFSIHVARTSTQHAVSPAWLDIPPDQNQVDETVLRGVESEPPVDPIANDDPDTASGTEVEAESSPDSELPKGTLCANRYVIEDPIAVGGMSTVYRAIDDRNGQLVALKVLRSSLVDDPNMVETFAREADNAWSLSHRGFVKVLAQGWIDAQPFLALEYLEGQSLSTAMRREFATGAPWPVARRILTRIGSAIAHAHARGLVHADLKPGNIFLLENGDPRILDLGAAQVVHGEARLDQERDRDVSGGALTPAYASAEMLLGASAEPRDDIFSLAVIGYELIAGRHPYDRYTADRARHLDLRPTRPPGLPAQAWRTLRRGLELRRSSRPHKMRAFVAGLQTPFPTVTVALGTITLATLIAVAVWTHHHHDEASHHWETGRRATELTIDLLGLRPLPERPIDSLSIATRLSEATGWHAPRDILVQRLSDRLQPEVLHSDDNATLDRAAGAVITLRESDHTDNYHSESTLVVIRAILARLSTLIQQPTPLPLEPISHLLELLHEVDPDGVRVVATHLTDLLNERRHTLNSDAERAEFDRLAGVLVERFPIVPPPIRESYWPTEP
ncbi:Serine/Threonine protein kinase [alpha proteobacterium BAL199]|nr:Serine/Threonine protein kinase [alpha proteobacterium BAL199]